MARFWRDGGPIVLAIQASLESFTKKAGCGLLEVWKLFPYSAPVTTKQRFRNNKFRLEVRERDHGPAHCHLVGGEVDLIIELATLRTEGRWPRGLRAEVMAWVEANLDDLWKEWNKWHP